MEGANKMKTKSKIITEILLVAVLLFLSQINNEKGIGYVEGATFGKAYGAGYYDTSRYMAGDIAVGIFFTPGTADNWTPEEIDNSFSRICDILNQFIHEEPNANISFTFIKEIDEWGMPKAPPTDTTARFDYVNNLRNTYNTAWAFMIDVKKGYAHPITTRPCIRIGSYYISEGTLHHETMHLFGAADQYASTGPTARYGYLNVVNANSEYNNGKGYFGGAGEGAPDLMNHGGPIGVYSRGQIGWRDSDGDGILDPLDTYPDTKINSKTGTNPFSYSGSAEDKACLNETKASYHNNITINSISKVEYRINGSAWQKAIPTDGTFDYAYEDFTFATPALKDGVYTIEVRSTNSVGNQEISYARNALTVTGSAVTNTIPFPAFTIRPKERSIDTNFIFDASESTDLENDGFALQIRWDFDNDGMWNTPFSTDKITSFRYSTSGTKTVKLEVIDSEGLTSSVTKQVDVAAINIPPKASFTVTPENNHGDNTFEVVLDASSSYDGEDDVSELQVCWDFEDDGVWDTGYSNNLITEHTYSLAGDISKHYRMRVEIKDIIGNTSQATRDVWAVTYNHPPLLEQSFELNAGVLCVLDASDHDTGTTWDGLLEYRWDFENDGVWDTTFSESSYVTLPASYQNNSIVCEVKDRFDATSRAIFVNDPTPPPAPAVTDEGESTTYTYQLYAQWTCQDPESAIVEYQYRITQDSPTGVVIREWTSTGVDNYVTAGGLDLIGGKTYYFGVKAKNAAGLWSKVGYSDGITVIVEPHTTSISPISASIGDEVAITGYNFGSTQGNGYVEFYDGIQAQIQSWSDTEIVFKVTKSTGGNVRVSVVNEYGRSNEVDLSITLTWGDVSGNGSISGMDAAMVAQYLAGITSLSDEQKRVADVTQNGEITTLDADVIARYRVGLISSLPVTNHAPELDNPGNRTVALGKSVEFKLNAADPDADTLRFSGNNLPSGATLDAASGEFSWQPTQGQVGSHPITFLVSDGELSDSETIAITVNALTQPKISYISPRLGGVGTRLFIRGENFLSHHAYKSRVVFSGSRGSQDARKLSWRDTIILCYVPDLPAGTYDVTIINKDGAQSTPYTFEIISVQEIDQIVPSQGTAESEVILYGKHFVRENEYIRVYMYGPGGRGYIRILSTNDNRIVFKVPRFRSPGRYTVRVLTNRGWSNYAYFEFNM